MKNRNAQVVFHKHALSLMDHFDALMPGVLPAPSSSSRLAGVKHVSMKRWRMGLPVWWGRSRGRGLAEDLQPRRKPPMHVAAEKGGGELFADGGGGRGSSDPGLRRE